MNMLEALLGDQAGGAVRLPGQQVGGASGQAGRGWAVTDIVGMIGKVLDGR